MKRRLKDILKKIIYIIGSLLIRKVKKKYCIEKINSILFIALFFRGDVLFYTPVLRILKLIYPNSKLDVWVKSRSKEVLENNPDVNKIIIFDDIKTAEYGESNRKFNFFGKIKLFRELKKNHYDLIVDYTGFYTSAIYSLFLKPKISIGRNNQGFGFCYNNYVDIDIHNTSGNLIIKYIDIIKNGLLITEHEFDSIIKYLEPRPIINININDEIIVKNELSSRGYNFEEPLVCLHLTAGWDAKRWELDNYIELVRKLLMDFKYQVIIIGDSTDEIEFYKLVDKLKDKIPENELNKIFVSLSFIQSACVVKYSDVFIGSDSAPLHIAGAVGTPSIGLFGPTNPLFSNPIREKHIVLYKELICSAAKDKQYCTRNAGKNCSTIDCLKMITVEEVLFNINYLLNTYKKHSI